MVKSQPRITKKQEKPPGAEWGSRPVAASGSPSPNGPRPAWRERCSADEEVIVAAAVAGDAVEGEGTPGAWDEEGGDGTGREEGGVAMGEETGGGVGGGGGVGQAIPRGMWLCGMVTGEGAGNVGGPLGNGEGGFWLIGHGVAIGMRGHGPVALPGGLLIMTGGDGGKGVKLDADQTTDLG
ncbi:unnamed protein product [Menidia menidia]|uniref:(Atlantic silverside) hypothetical protein n=1 Tax=Menidia menidia TaxID=238744 RepID=A0A8S4BHI4_9TELE|nr:unnamed protein product [Menidia menidia]